MLAYPLLSWGRVGWLLGPDQDQGFLDILWLQTVAVPRQGSQHPASRAEAYNHLDVYCSLQVKIDIYDENIFKFYLLYVFVTYLT